MRAVIQRVQSASVSVNGEITGKTDGGLLIYLGVGFGDTLEDLEYIYRKTVNLRIFSDEDGKMNKSLKDMGKGVLIVSQFTLYGDVRKGTRPSFSTSAPPDEAELLYEAFKSKFKEDNIKAEYGVFGADMKVSSVNDGPVTILLDSKKLF